MKLTQHVANEIIKNREHIALSTVTSYHLLEGNCAVDNYVTTLGQDATLYTGNGSTQSIVTGIDMKSNVPSVDLLSLWTAGTYNTGDERYILDSSNRKIRVVCLKDGVTSDPNTLLTFTTATFSDWKIESQTNGGMYWIKGRSIADSNYIFDTTRNNFNAIVPNITSGETLYTERLNAFNQDGFSVTGNARVNTSSATYVSWGYQTTHIVSGLTNHNQPYITEYNPVTLYQQTKYKGSSLAGHQIPNYINKKINFATIKNLSSALDWINYFGKDNKALFLNLTLAEATPTGTWESVDAYFKVLDTLNLTNTSGSLYIMYGYANSYYDESGKLIGNYNTYLDGNGVLRHDVHDNISQSNVIRQMSKTTLATGDWDIVDYARGNTKELNANLQAVESTITANTLVNTSGGSYYPKASETAQLQVNNALIPFAQGVDVNGMKNTILSKNETFTYDNYPLGKSYPYYDKNGNIGVSSIAPSYGTVNPLLGDFYNIKTNKWYDNTDAELTESRGYLDVIAHGDSEGNLLYVEELPKIQYIDRIKSNEFKGQNANSAKCRVNGTSTPVTFYNKHNVEYVVRTATGLLDFYVNDSIDINESTIELSSSQYQTRLVSISGNKITIETSNSGGTLANADNVSLTLIGGN